ncbi:phage portal protein [Paenarthrobacter nicotinovorans]|uniref:phage portal protein n=1 Tax=Paenarthrobacter nicotinovorans TaxID=29320 RepID=UPI0007E62147|nr:phage portal protein [Paenarthrobacter nicotinovorans]
MAFFDFLFGAGEELTARQEMNASFIDSIPLESPWADNSHLETITLANLYGLTPDTLPVNRTSAMQIASIAKGRNLIATSIARMPLKATRNGSLATNQPTLLTQLQTGTPNFITLSWTVDSMLFYGRAFWLITDKSFDGRPLHVKYIPESQVETKDGQLVKAFGKTVSPSDFIRIDANNEGFLAYGAGVIREAQEIELAAREAGASPVPSIVLKQMEGNNLSQEEITALVAQWTAARRKRGGSVAYANKAIDVESLGQHAENLLIEGRNYAALQVARALGLPAWAVDATVAGASLNYSNQASRNRELIDALTGFMTSIEQTLSLFLPAGTEVKFDTAELLKGDTKERYDAYAVGIAAGFLTKDEARARENLEPLPVEEQVAPEIPAEPQPTPDEESADE